MPKDGCPTTGAGARHDHSGCSHPLVLLGTGALGAGDYRAIAAGPLIGGYLISAASWRWIFFINVPIATVVVALGARHIPESRDRSVTGRIDYAGALAAVVFLTGITFALIEARRRDRSGHAAAI